jgi:hypothetical protein
VFVLISALALLAAEPAPSVSPVDVTAPQRSSIPVGQIGVKDPDRLTCRRESVVGSRRKDQAQQIMDSTRTTGDSKPR